MTASFSAFTYLPFLLIPHLFLCHVTSVPQTPFLSNAAINRMHVEFSTSDLYNDAPINLDYTQSNFFKLLCVLHVLCIKLTNIGLVMSVCMYVRIIQLENQ
jgi:hypothetical protein